MCTPHRAETVSRAHNERSRCDALTNSGTLRQDVRKAGAAAAAAAERVALTLRQWCRKTDVRQPLQGVYALAVL